MSYQKNSRVEHRVMKHEGLTSITSRIFTPIPAMYFTHGRASTASKMSFSIPKAMLIPDETVLDPPCDPMRSFKLEKECLLVG
jgi:hypothetical protein